MMVQKKHGKAVRAYELGAGTEAEQRMIAEGKILVHPDGSYELFSQETDQHGEHAKAGDFFKIDSSDQPYPNARAYFMSNQRMKHIISLLNFGARWNARRRTALLSSIPLSVTSTTKLPTLISILSHGMSLKKHTM